MPPRPGSPPAEQPLSGGLQRVPPPSEPQPSDEQRREEAARQQRAAARAQKEAEVPSFGRDLLRSVGLAVFAQVFFGSTILLVRWRVLHYNNLEPVEDAHSWAQVVVMVIALMWVFLQMKRPRPDLGFRRSGLVPFLLIAVVLVTLVQLVAMLVWPLLIGPDLKSFTVLAEVWSDPVAFLIAAGVVLFLNAMFTAIVLPMITCGWKAALVCLLPYLGMIVLGGYLAVVVLDSPPLITGAALWMGAGLLGLVLLAASSLVVVWFRRDDIGAERTRAASGGMSGRPSL